MGKRGPKPKGKVRIKWSSNFAYAIGLLATDGCITSNRHINFTSKDFEQILNFQKGLGIGGHIAKKARGHSKDKKYFVFQFGDVLLVNFLSKIGITPAKSKTLGPLQVPQRYFFHFLRGVFDGDGYSHSYWDPRWKSSFLMYVCFTSASPDFIDWIRRTNFEFLNIKGHITKSEKNSCYQLKYGKKESLVLVQNMYSSSNILCLGRKRLKIVKALAIVRKC